MAKRMGSDNHVLTYVKKSNSVVSFTVSIITGRGFRRTVGNRNN